MKRFNIYILATIILTVLCMSSCSRRMVGYGAGAAAPAPSQGAAKVITLEPIAIQGASRYASLESYFESIAYPFDAEELNYNMQEVLEMCESAETQVTIYGETWDVRALLFEMSIREYLSILEETMRYEDEIEEVSYNDEGKIMSIILSRFDEDLLEEDILEEAAEEVEMEFGEAEEAELNLEEATEAEMEAEIARLLEELEAAEAAEAAVEELKAPPPAAAAPPPQPSPAAAPPPTYMAMPSASRYAPIENHFKIIAGSEDYEEVLNSVNEVLEMCESNETHVFVYNTDFEELVVDTTIRVYMEFINDAQLYEDEIGHATYNYDGKITSLEMIRY
ncbi:hypothetical protein ACFLQX_01870 [Bacteroidota bacterium]